MSGTATTRTEHAVRDELRGIAAFVIAIWAVFLVSLVFPSTRQWGLVPRTTRGLLGILSMPFLHANLQHLLANTVPLVVLLCLLAGSQARSSNVVVAVMLAGGSLLWVFGRGQANHIGASGLVFGLVTFLILAGILERRITTIAVSVVTVLLYGGTLWGVLPSDPGVSWDGHLCGAVAGGLTAFGVARGKRGDGAERLSQQ